MRGQNGEANFVSQNEAERNILNVDREALRGIMIHTLHTFEIPVAYTYYAGAGAVLASLLLCPYAFVA
jgi:hypothetical protein